jgi:microcystin-dependent protein
MPVSPFLSEIMITSFNFPPKGWALCNGQLLPINQNQALFSLLGTTYGGDGRVNFGLPDLRGKVPIHMGSGFVLGQKAGEYIHTLILSEMTAHNHGMFGKAVTATARLPGTTMALAQGHATGPGTPAVNIYGTGAISEAFAPTAISNTGGSQPHSNQQPFLTLSFCIALQGIFPSTT